MDTLETDRISALPDEILVHLLSFLPIKQAIRLSILANRWRYLWTIHPTIEFPFHCHSETVTSPPQKHSINDILSDRWRSLWSHMSELPYRDPRSSSNRLQVQEFNNIYTCLNLFKPNMTIHRLQIELRHVPSMYFTRWIKFAITRDVGELILRVGFCRNEYRVNLPCELFSCRSITSLVLWSVVFDPPLRFSGLSNLKLLELVCVKLTDQAVDSILVNYPFLEDLTLRYCQGLKNLVVTTSALCLKKLIVFFCMGLEKLVLDSSHLRIFEYYNPVIEFCLVNVPNLLEIDLDMRGSSQIVTVEDWRQMIRKIVQVKLLKMGSWFTELLFAEYYINTGPQNLSQAIFMNLKEFHWFGHLLSEKLVLAIATFLGACPLLEKLFINLDQDSFFVDHWKSHESLFLEKYFPQSLHGNAPLPYKQYLRRLGYSLHHLKMIEIVGFSGHKREMDLVTFLLNKSLVLESFQIFVSVNTVKPLAPYLQQGGLSRLPKVSSSAKIVLLEHPWNNETVPGNTTRNMRGIIENFIIALG